jgi:hypothetical protein
MPLPSPAKSLRALFIGAALRPLETPTPSRSLLISSSLSLTPSCKAPLLASPLAVLPS